MEQTKMIYDDIETTISGFLSTNYSLSGFQILTQNEVPDDSVDFFVRQVWSYGTMSEIDTLDIRELSILNLEVYDRKNNSENKILDFIRDIRYYVYKKMSMFYSTTNKSYAKLNGIYILKNMNDDTWISYTVGIRFYIYKEK